MSRAKVIKSANFRLVIPNLQHHTDPDELLKLKGDTLNLILQRESKKNLRYYSIAAQTHPTTGIPHLDILLLYQQSVQLSLNRFDYLIKHGHLTRYKKLNEAILAYGKKQDPSPLSNLPSNLSVVLSQKRIRSDPYQVLEEAMLLDPFHFDPISWLNSNNLTKDISKTSWRSAISLVKQVQQDTCNKLLRAKKGFKLITRQLIQTSLTPSQLATYDSWPGYQIIVDHLNQIPTYGSYRPSGTPNLMIVSATPGIGKTSLFQDNNPLHHSQPISALSSIYIMGMKHWFPKYKSGTYQLILWNQSKLTSYPYDTILKLLQGFPIDLPYHGGATKKDDNPLVVMTSNLSLERHVHIKFSNLHDRQLALASLRRRITEVIVLPDLELFLLQKLIFSFE